MTSAFAGKQCVITGGTGALGSAVAEHLLQAGATLWIPCVKPEELARCSFANDPRVTVKLGVDLADDAAVRAFFAQAAAQGPIWASIHIAGGFVYAPLLDTSFQALQQQLTMNAVTAFLCTREAARHMSSTGGGRIVNIAARPALEPRTGANMSAYTAAKAAVAAMTIAHAEELAPRGILVNAVAPSIMDTPANRGAMPTSDHAQWPSVADVARTIAFLASPENTVTRGAVLTAYGRC